MVYIYLHMPPPPSDAYVWPWCRALTVTSHYCALQYYWFSIFFPLLFHVVTMTDSFAAPNKISAPSGQVSSDIPEAVWCEQYPCKPVTEDEWIYIQRNLIRESRSRPAKLSMDEHLCDPGEDLQAEELFILIRWGQHFCSGMNFCAGN